MDQDQFRISLEALGQGIRKLPSLPAVVFDLLQSIEDESIDNGMLAQKISRDQALVAKMLRMANSSFYGLQGKVDSIQDAIVILGLQGVRTLAMATAVVGSFGSGLVSSRDFRIFWRHSIGVALCARAVARRTQINQDHAFIVGLLHDIGRLVLVSTFPREMQATLEYRTQHDCQAIDAEQAVLGIDHAQVARILTESWKFPPLISEAIATHHAPDMERNAMLACVVHVADAIVHALDLSGDEAEMLPRIQVPCWNAVGLSWRDSQEVFAEVESQFENICGILVS